MASTHDRAAEAIRHCAHDSAVPLDERMDNLSELQVYIDDLRDELEEELENEKLDEMHSDLEGEWDGEARA